MSLARFIKGFVIVIVGAILLLNNLNILGWTVWLNIVRLWPLLLVSIGISLIFQRRLAWLGPLILLLGIVFAISASYMGIDFHFEDKIPTELEIIQRELEMVPRVIPETEHEIVPENEKKQEDGEDGTETEGSEEEEEEKLLLTEADGQVNKEDIMVPLVQKANINLNYSVATFTLKESTPLLYYCQVNYRYPEFKPVEEYSISDHVANVLITHQPIPNEMMRHPKNQVDLQLNKDVIYNIFLETGATAIDFDLSAFKIETLSIKSGASSMNIIAPQYNGKFDISSGVSQIDITLPNSVGAIVYLDSGLSIKDIDQNFLKLGNDNIYRSKNYDDAENKIDIKINSGISRINIHY